MALSKCRTLIDDDSMSSPISIVETHVSTLFFVGDRVYKRKKPLQNGFLDFTSVTTRRAICHREVELNRRLASDVYLGVADLNLEGAELEHFVVMKRMPEDRRLSARLQEPSIRDDLRDLSHLIAAFHARAERSEEIDAASGHAAMSRLWEEGLAQISSFSGSVLDPIDVAHSAELAREYLAGRQPLFDERVSEGHACDGHGDLQAEDVFVMDDGVRVLDCLEFDDRLRYGDVLADVSFLAMDLERLGHPELARVFLDDYRELSGDNWPTSLAHHHMAYRAHVRAKVACLRHEQGDPDAASAARALQWQALAHLESARVRLVVVGGSPGTGKSSVSKELAERLGAVLLSSDVIRDEILPRTGDGSGELDEGRYAPERVAAVYAELMRRAELLVSRGESVVLDASWLEPQRREEIREVAARTASRFSELRCDCSEDLAATRIRRRAAVGVDPSEATPELARQLATDAPPWPEATTIDTAGSLGDAIGLAESVATRP